MYPFSPNPSPNVCPQQYKSMGPNTAFVEPELMSMPLFGLAMTLESKVMVMTIRASSVDKESTKIGHANA
jgi:hypothetical protein